MTFKEAIELLKEKKSLTKEQSYTLFKKLALEEFDEAEVEEFLKALREKGETWEEIAGAVKAYREVMKPFEHGLPDSVILIDTCGTGGDAKHTFNFSTAVALALTVEEDVFVVKHGNRSVSSKSGSVDLIEALGIPLDLPQEVLKETLRKVRFVFLFAPLYHPAFARVAPIRKRIGRTIFNLLGPLLNPARPNYQLLGVYDFRLTEKMAYVLDDLGVKRAMVVWGEDGYDEITVTGSTKVSELENGRITTYYLDPEDFGFERCLDERELKVKDCKESLEILYKLFDNSLEGPIRDMFLLNFAGALYVCGKAIDFKGALKKAKKYLEEKELFKNLEEILNFYSKIKN